jgi:peptidoglycan/xylan/chitin deacetylase (PgdA/CDA1 family)
VKATLTYHSLDDSGSAISVTPVAFANHRRWLLSGRVRVLPLDQLVTHDDDAEDAVAITFDDGFANVRGAVTELLANKLPVTLFAVSGRVGTTNEWNGQPQRGIPTLPLLSWTDLEQLTVKGLRVEAHSCSHASFVTLSDAALDDELQRCQDDLHARLGAKSMHLAYPYGDVNDAVADRARAMYRYAHTTEFRVVTNGDAALRLPRLDMYYFQEPGVLESWGTQAFARRLAWCATRRRLRSRIAGGLPLRRASRWVG